MKILEAIIVATITALIAILFEEAEIYIILIIILLFIISFMIYKKIKVYKKSILPKPADGKIGILIVHDASHEESEAFFINTFLKELRKQSACHTPDIDILEPSQEAIKKHKLLEEPFGQNVEYMKEAKVYLIIRCFIKQDGNEDKRIQFSLANTLFYSKRDEHVRNSLENEMKMLYGSLLKLEYRTSQNIEQAEKDIKLMQLVCQYFVAISLITIGKNQRGQDILENLLAQIKSMRPSFEIIKILQRLVPIRLFNLYDVSWDKLYGDTDYDKYLKNIDLVKLQLDRMGELVNYNIKNMLQMFVGRYYLLMARYMILNGIGDSNRQNRIKLAKEFNVKYKALYKNKTKMDCADEYNDIFLNAYGNLNLRTCQRKILKMLKKKISDVENLLAVISFIEYVIEKEPEEKQLHLLLGYYYKHVKDSELARENFVKFKAVCCDSELGAIIDQEISNLM